MRGYVLIVAIALILMGCESSGDLRINNRTSHNVYFTVNGSDYTVEGGQSKSVELDVDRDWQIFETNSKQYSLDLEGETYKIWDSYNGMYINHTDVDIENGKTLDVYAIPNLACIKIVNNGDLDIARVACDKYINGNMDHPNLVLTNTAIEPGSTWYLQIEGAYTGREIAYVFYVTFADGARMEYPLMILDVDEMFLLEL